MVPAARLHREALKVPPLMLPTSLLQDRPPGKASVSLTPYAAPVPVFFTLSLHDALPISLTVSPPTLAIARLGASTMSLAEALTLPGLLFVALAVAVLSS